MEQFKPKKDHCPVCDTEWTKSGFGKKIWYDCGPCGKTAEDIGNVESKNGGITYGGPNGDSYDLGTFEDWEKLLDDSNDDDLKFEYTVPYINMEEQLNKYLGVDLLRLLKSIGKGEK